LGLVLISIPETWSISGQAKPTGV
ncbi:hypothetical protein CCACVL1_08541, partial [Corchorus capsularis]